MVGICVLTTLQRLEPEFRGRPHERSRVHEVLVDDLREYGVARLRVQLVGQARVVHTADGRQKRVSPFHAHRQMHMDEAPGELRVGAHLGRYRGVRPRENRHTAQRHGADVQLVHQ